jgi:hypothetical protein
MVLVIIHRVKYFILLTPPEHVFFKVLALTYYVYSKRNVRASLDVLLVSSEMT